MGQERPDGQKVVNGRFWPKADILAVSKSASAYTEEGIWQFNVLGK
jgi:hypothetical protein